MRAVLDTDVVVACVISPYGASRLWLEAALRRDVTPVVSVPLALQYEAVLKRPEILARSRLAAGDIDDLLDGFLDSAVLVRSPIFGDPHCLIQGTKWCSRRR